MSKDLKTSILESYPDLELLNELLKRIKAGKTEVHYSVNKSDEKVMISMKNEKDKDALFLYMVKGKMSGFITDFETQMKKIHGGSYE